MGLMDAKPGTLSTELHLFAGWFVAMKTVKHFWLPRRDEKAESFHPRQKTNFFHDRSLKG